MADRPTPYIDATSEPYWAALKKHEFILPHCKACGKAHFYPRQVCPHCASLDIEWRKASGKGKIYSCTRVHRAPHPAFADKTPYVIALVELDEGPRMMTSIVDGIQSGAKIGDAVEVDFQDVTADLTLPAFRRRAG